MKKFSLLPCTALVLTCATFAFSQSPATAREIIPVRFKPIFANAGSTATLTPTTNAGVFKASASGVIQSSSLGTCVNNAELEVRFPASTDQPITATGTATWTTIDGKNSLKWAVTGTATPDSANAGFLNVKYQLTVTGGTGVYASATGVAEIEEVAMFTSPATATATWNMKGLLVTPR